MVDAATERYENQLKMKQAKRSNLTTKLPMNVLKADDTTGLIKNMRKVDVFISTKNWLPTKENCEKHICGLENLNFVFGSKEMLE